MPGRFCLAKLDFSNVLNKIQLVPLGHSDDFLRCASILAQHYEGVGGSGENMRSQVVHRWHLITHPG